MYFQQKSLWSIFFLFSSRKLSPEVDRTGANFILISVTKGQETIVNKFHEHIFLIIFIIYYWFSYIFYILIVILNDAVKDFWRDYS